MNAETWKPIPGYEDCYLVSDHGQVFNLRTQKRMALKSCSPYGHLCIGLTKDRKKRFLLIHHLVLTAFSGARGLNEEARHLNGVASDNRISNLKWGTRQDNADDRVKHGHSPRGARNGRAKLTPGCVDRVRELGRQGIRQADIAAYFGVVQSTVGTILRGVHWSREQL